MRLSVRSLPATCSSALGNSQPHKQCANHCMPIPHVRLELSSSACDRSLSWCDDPALRAESLVAAPSVAGSEQACWDLNQLPFRHLDGCRRVLRSELPADCFSGCGILLLFSGVYSH